MSKDKRKHAESGLAAESTVTTPTLTPAPLTEERKKALGNLAKAAKQFPINTDILTSAERVYFDALMRGERLSETFLEVKSAVESDPEFQSLAKTYASNRADREQAKADLDRALTWESSAHVALADYIRVKANGKDVGRWHVNSDNGTYHLSGSGGQGGTVASGTRKPPTHFQVKVTLTEGKVLVGTHREIFGNPVKSEDCHPDLRYLHGQSEKNGNGKAATFEVLRYATPFREKVAASGGLYTFKGVKFAEIAVQ